MLYVREGVAVRKRGYRPNLESIITDETNEGSIAAYGREIPDATVEITVAELPETTNYRHAQESVCARSRTAQFADCQSQESQHQAEGRTETHL